MIAVIVPLSVRILNVQMITLSKYISVSISITRKSIYSYIVQ